MRALVLAALLMPTGAFADEIGYTLTDIGTRDEANIYVSGINSSAQVAGNGTPDLELQISLTSSNSAQLLFTAQPNAGYVIECRDSLVEGDWLARVVVDPIPEAHTVVFNDPVSPGSKMRFYRVRGAAGVAKSATLPLMNESVFWLPQGADTSTLAEAPPEDRTTRAPETVFTAPEAGLLAQRLANDRAEHIYKLRPFRRNSPASWVGGAWLWRERQGYGRADFEAAVQFKANGTGAMVNVLLIESELSPGF